MTTAPNFMTDLRNSKAAALGFASVGIFWGSFAGLVPDLKSAIGASDGAFGGAMFVSSFGAIAAMWLAPRVDRALGARALQGAALAMALAFLLPGLAGTVAIFTCAMVLASAGSGTMDVIMNTRVSQIEARTGRSLMNLNHGLFSLAYAVAALSTGLFRELGFGPAFVFALMSVIAGALVLGMYSTDIASEGETGTGRLQRPWVALFGGVIILIAFMSEQATEAWSALLLERELGGSPAQGAIGPAILGLTMGVGRIGGQIFLSRFRDTHVIQIAAFIASVGLYIASQAQGLAMAYLGFAILGIGVSVTAPLAYSAIGKRVNDAQRAAMITRVSVIGYMGFFIGPPVMGGLSEIYGLRMSFLVMAAVLLLVVTVLVPGLRRQPEKTGALP